jgi:ribosomal protein S18 acetylase RimI-like enzyme
MKIELVPLNETAPCFLDAVAIYGEYVPGDLRYQRVFFQTHMSRQGYMGFAAVADDVTVGFAFGSDSLAGQWWHEKVLLNLDEECDDVLQDAWVLTQLNVLQAYRNAGIGGLLHDALIAAQTRTHLLLSTPVSNHAAQRFYQRRGWRTLHAGFCFSKGMEPFMILHLPRVQPAAQNGA